ncbi:hypothetical protein [Ferviditalea candida]|uniref:Uncharacterized protein n=1 Tax=Ferviditalea candida TaxID=3108399 RepID=A0ABU5ZFN0_9BACL|nr:hypothetical protein [Paenibacillaceae bacterium T2]
MKLRLLPIMISLIGTTVLLFGGWFVYQSVAMESPLSSIVRQLPGVEQASAEISASEIRIDLKLKQDASLREIMETIRKEGKSVIGDRKLNVVVTNPSTESLDRIWSGALFDVAQAMEKRNYSSIPDTLEALAEKYGNIRTSAEMDEENVYIRISDGTHSKFVILPRVSERLGVWPNE